MSKIKLTGDTSGYVEISAPNVAANNTLELGGGTKILTNLDNVFTGVTTYSGNIDLNANLDLDDNNKILLGTGDDIEIFHNGTDSFVRDVGTGSLYIDSTSGEVVLRVNDTENAVVCRQNAEVELYHNGSQKFETTTTGVEVSGATKTNTLEVTQEYPSIRPTLDLNFAATKTLDRRITFTRDGVGTYTDDMGIIKYSSNNTPRFDHDPVTGESLGLLIEESRTNQMIYSSDITNNGSQNTSYGVQNGTVTGDQTTAPDGTTTADKYAANSTNGLHRVDLFFTSGQISNSTAYTFSVFVKANGYDKLHIRYGGYNADNHGLGYDLSDGTTFAGKFDGTSSLGAVTSSSMIAYPNGWYRCSFTFTTASDATSGSAAIFYYISNSESTTNFAGDGSSGMYFWGAQMEIGSFPTSYISTSGSTVTRAADLVKITGTNFTDFYNQNEGTFFIDSAVARGSAYQGYVGSTTNSTANGGPSYNFNSLMSDADNSDILLNIWDGTGSAQALIPIAHPTGNMKAAGAFKDNDFAISMNGSAVSTDTSGTIDTNQDQLWIGRRPYANAGWLNNSIKRVVYYNKRLPNAQLQGLTQQ